MNFSYKVFWSLYKILKSSKLGSWLPLNLFLFIWHFFIQKGSLYIRTTVYPIFVLLPSFSSAHMSVCLVYFSKYIGFSNGLFFLYKVLMSLGNKCRSLTKIGWIISLALSRSPRCWSNSRSEGWSDALVGDT